VQLGNPPFEVPNVRPTSSSSSLARGPMPPRGRVLIAVFILVLGSSLFVFLFFRWDLVVIFYYMECAGVVSVSLFGDSDCNARLFRACIGFYICICAAR
jgi:hypothetical protein